FNPYHLFTILPDLFRALPSLRQFELDFINGDDFDGHSCLDPSYSSFLQRLCTSHNILLTSRRLFSPFGGYRRDDRSTTSLENTSHIYLKEKCNALLEVLGKASELVRHAQAAKDGQAMEQMLEWAEPFHRRLLVRQEKRVDQPGMGPEPSWEEEEE
ncbi:hypothetical protein JCM11641_006564, partial [Rhodosporidiobolus odoratus]